jgi:hypothetical protein
MDADAQIQKAKIANWFWNGFYYNTKVIKTQDPSPISKIKYLMMNILSKTMALALAMMSCTVTFGQLKTEPASTPAPPAKTVSIHGVFENPLSECKIDTVYLYVWTGAMPEPALKVPTKVENGKLGFTFTVDNTNIGFVLIGTDPQKARAVLLQYEPVIEMTGNCFDFQGFKVSSVANVQYNNLLVRQQGIMNQFVGILQQYQQLNQMPNPMEKKAVLDKQLGDLDKVKLALLDSLKKANPFLLKIANLNTYISYQNNAQRPDQTEGQYFAENFLKFVDFNDPNYFQIPAFHETMKNFAANSAMVAAIADRNAKRTVSELKLNNVRRLPAIFLGCNTNIVFIML